jgi:glycosyltransferase involved in cell wall biosynthesis
MSKLKIRSQAMLGTTHSWAVTLRSLLKEFLLMDHDLYLNSINGYDLFPKEWTKFCREGINADIDLTYTLPRNFKIRYNRNSKLKLAIYNYESSILPKVWVDKIQYIDYALPSSNFSKEVFVNSGWPEEKCIVVPHGVNLEDFEDKSKVNNLKTKKKFKFLNVSIPHYRKNIGTLIDAYYSAFTDNDDVCLLLKIKLAKPKYRFECDVMREILNVQKKHKGKRLPQLEVVQNKYKSMVPLYNSCDCLVSSSSAEGFGLPLLEGLAAGMIVVAPRCTGQLDFLNNDNSLLVDVKEINATDKYQYWKPSPGAKTYIPHVDSLAENMKKVYENHKELKKKFAKESRETVERLTWRNAAKQILDIS